MILSTQTSNIFAYFGEKEGLKILKDAGFNAIRSAHNPASDAMLRACDELGLYVMDETWDMWDQHKTKCDYAGRFTENWRQDVRYMIAKDYNHPSVVYYTVFDEGWGQFKADKQYLRLKNLDPSRIWDATSGWFTSKKSDVQSEHIYFKKLKLKNDPQKPLVLSEFGGYSYKVENHSFNLDKTYGYSFFTDREKFGNALEALYLDEVIPMIDRGLCATVYTQVSDVEDETNGLLTYDRQILKVDPARMTVIAKTLNDAFIKQTAQP